MQAASRVGLAFASPTKSSKNTSIALNALLTASFTLHRSKPSLAILSDNRSDLLKDFHKTLDKHGITHYFIYPKKPKMNAHCERSNRTLQELFVDYHEDLLFTDLTIFNQRLAECLIKYNTIVPQHGLELLCPKVHQLPPGVPDVVGQYRSLTLQASLH